MDNQYQYIDPDHVYADSKSGVLHNLVNAADLNTLLLIESGAVTKRITDLYENPIKIKNSSTLLAIHKYLFQDIYAWAGEVRSVEISKEGKSFFPLSHFRNAFTFIDSLIDEYRGIDRDETARLTYKLAEILDNINYLHPFRDGNGRVQREFIRLLAAEKDLLINLNPPDNVNIYKRYMQGTINGNVEQLAALMLEIAVR